SSGDGQNSQVYMYVGIKTPAAPDPLVGNGLTNGSLFVLAGDDPLANSEATFNVKGSTIPMHWAQVNYNQNDTNLDLESKAVGSFLFVRVEDGAYDPSHPSDFYFVTTGRPTSVNPFGRLYRLRVNLADPTAGATLTLVLDGTEGMVSPDNVAVNTHGQIMICEDPNYDLSLPPISSTRDTYLWRYDIGAATLTPIAELDRAAAVTHALAADPLNSNVASSNVPGGWEFSGVIDAEPWTGIGTWFVDVQAHSLRINPSSENVEGGQILLVRTGNDL